MTYRNHNEEIAAARVAFADHRLRLASPRPVEPARTAALKPKLRAMARAAFLAAAVAGNVYIWAVIVGAVAEALK